MIPKEFKESIEIEKKYKNYILNPEQTNTIPEDYATDKSYYETGEYDSLSEIALKALQEIEDEAELCPEDKFELKIRRTLAKEYEKLKDSKEFFGGCNFEAYEKSYNKRRDKYLKKYKDSLEIDFIKDDYNRICNYSYAYHREDIKTQISISFSRQKEYLIQKSTLLGYQLRESRNNLGEIICSYFKIADSNNNYPLIDLSDTKGKHKVIYLELLGIIDYLKTKPKVGFSINGLASVLSAITGEKSTALQSYLNTMNNAQTKQSNNPMKGKKPDQIKLKLIELGYIHS